ncbi:alanine/glycine:cation symporter family protein [Kocuria palustris]|uniref:alanine/glycine:cation symporter family protein n=1 Tax=Kocuria palustris TaxID=71999 RepID=UPI00195C2106|nr:alanine/glycine:cation symporter family protein [Kocuria palustris]MBM7822814.1 AGCS family alanine or glycine:cation symporter [Kocuria palustris]
MEQLTELVGSVGNFIWSWIVFAILIGTGIYLTIRTRAVQWRSVPEMFRVLRDPPGEDPDGKKSISSFRAFTVSAASRVGTGNIAGVAIAISVGGPGAVFWMWAIAAIGGASAFVESLLGQLYKRKGETGYYGGPAYYMTYGLKKHWMGILFAVIITVTYGLVFNSVQSNAIVDSLSGSLDIDPSAAGALPFKLIVGAVVVVLTASIIFGGARRISAVTQAVVPVMAILYVLLGLLVVVLNIGEVPGMVADIVLGAFGIREFVVGGFMAVFVQGLRRGLFSNEAGMGSAPNAGASASVSHPAKQGFVQSLGVYFDTWLVCSVTAFIVLLSNPSFGDSAQGASLTQTALGLQLGTWAVHFLTIAIFLFAFSSVIGNYFYGEANIMFLTRSRAVMNGYRLLVLLSVMVGSVVALDLVWSLADVMMAIMATINLIALILLAPIAVKVMKNYEAQRRRGEEPTFNGSDIPGFTGLDAWDGTDVITTGAFWTQQMKRVGKA